MPVTEMVAALADRDPAAAVREAAQRSSAAFGVFRHPALRRRGKAQMDRSPISATSVQVL
jgi:hypothetical protein